MIFDPDQVVLLLPGRRWQQCSPHHHSMQRGWYVLCSSELMPNNPILSTTTLSGHFTHVEWEWTADQISFIGANHSLLLKSVKNCQLPLAEDLCKDLKVSILEPFIPCLPYSVLENLLVQEATYMLNLPPICTLPSNQQAFSSRCMGSWWQSKQFYSLSQFWHRRALKSWKIFMGFPLSVLFRISVVILLFLRSA